MSIDNKALALSLSLIVFWHIGDVSFSFGGVVHVCLFGCYVLDMVFGEFSESSLLCSCLIFVKSGTL